MGHNRGVTRDDVSAPDGSGDPEEDSGGKRRSGQDFPRASFFRRGYACAEVDAFLHEADRALRREPPPMAPYEVQDARFRGVRWRRGYDMRLVDERMEKLYVALRDRHGDDTVSGIQGHVSERSHRVAFWIYVGATVLVLVIIAFALTQIL
jgi:DivIVA domain-containing protein